MAKLSESELAHLRFVYTMNQGGNTRTKIGHDPSNQRRTRKLVKLGLMSMDNDGYTNITDKGRDKLGV